MFSTICLLQGSARVRNALLAGATIALLLPSLPADAAKRPGSSAAADTPLTLVVDLAAQRVRGYRGTDPVWSSRISSGKRGHRTPTGVFSIIQKRRRHFSNLYNDAPMPHMQRLTWSGIAFHGGPIPGYPASHGCVRLPYGEARKLFRMTNTRATRVVVTHGSPRPTAFSHALLPNRLPEHTPDPHPADERQPNDNPNHQRPPRGAPSDAIASADTARLVNSVLGVSSALAAPGGRVSHTDRSTTGPARSRAEVVARLEGEIEHSRTALEQAEAEVPVARATVEVASRTLRAMTASLRKATRELGRAERSLAHLARQETAMVGRMARLIKANLEVGEIAPDRLEQLAANEADLDARLADVIAEKAVFQGEALDLRSAVAALELGVARHRADYGAARQVLAGATKAAEEAKSAHERAGHALKQHDLPVHILISRSTGRIYARQGFKDIFEADVTFADAEAPIGTHVFTAIEEADDHETLRWSAITVPDAKSGKRRVSRKRKSRQTEDSARLTARDALDRVTLPETAERMMRELVKTGSSIIVSDRGPSIETGKGTDFIILTR